MEVEKMEKRLLRVPEAAARLAIRESTIRKWIILKKISVVRIGRTVTIPEESIEKIIRDGYSAALPEG
ncbi:MAG TPA: DNA-binding protein [Nitrospiria bacterium]|nr:DNA-binding protein [Candidatus Manganitrophaceae bacterium]HIL34990.1 DNA-binding protein [Candidatus Manganitrophaceae bacterium]